MTEEEELNTIRSQNLRIKKMLLKLGLLKCESSLYANMTQNICAQETRALKQLILNDPRLREEEISTNRRALDSIIDIYST